MFLFYSQSDDEDDRSITYFHGSGNAILPKFVDWRVHGAVTYVKDQSSCGSCWSFASTGALESQYFIKTGRLISLSEQFLVDCTHKNGNFGCIGGWAVNAYKYIRNHGGIPTEQSYPYYASDNFCRSYTNNSGVTVGDIVKIPVGDEHKLQEAIATVGPVVITIDASLPSFQNYQSGIYYDPQCSSTSLDHEVTAVGYGTDQHQQDYYIVKNSWGNTWGENGYIKIARNHMNHCGIASNALYPVISSQQHKSI